MIKIKIIKNVQGSKESSKPIIVSVDTVYIHSNIKKNDVDFRGNPTDNLYIYDEIQYNKNEYLELIANRQKTESELTTLLDLEVNTQKEIQATESDLLTVLDLNVLDLLERIEKLENEINSKGTNLS